MRKYAVGLISSALLAATIGGMSAPASAQDSKPMPVNKSIVVEDERVSVPERDLQPVAESDAMGRPTRDAQQMLDLSAREGSLIDLEELEIKKTETGMLVATSDDFKVVKVEHQVTEEAQVPQTDGTAPGKQWNRKGERSSDTTKRSRTQDAETATTEGMGVQVEHLETDDPALDMNVPVGPGSLNLSGMGNKKCFTARGKRYYNNITWCYQKHFLDGGNGRKAYGASDDDGSRYSDYYTYKRSATIQADKTPYRDYFVRKAHVFSWPSYNTRVHRRSELLDWTPTGSKCQADSTFTVPIGSVKWSTPACSSGTNISFSERDGRFKHRYSCTICTSDTKSVGFQVGIEVKQGTIPYWFDDNYASFRQNFSSNTDRIDN